MTKPTPVEAAILDEKRRITQIIKAHESWFAPAVFSRIMGMIEDDIDLEEEATFAPQDRVGWFTWPDQKVRKKKRPARKK